LLNPPPQEFSERYDLINDLRDPRVLKQLSILEENLKKMESVDGFDNPARAIKEVNNGRIPQEIEEVKDLISQNPHINNYYSHDYTTIKADVESQTQITEDDYDQMLEIIESIPFPEEVAIVPQGGVAEGKELDSTMSGDILITTLLGFLFVIALAALIYRSITVGVMAFIPIIFSVIWTVSIMGYIDLPFTILTTGMLAILMGVGIDFSIHLMHRIREETDKGQNIKNAVMSAMTETGEAISFTTITTIVGFLALTLASLLVTQRLGLTLAIGIGSTFFSCIILVPAVMAVQYFSKQKKLEKQATMQKIVRGAKK